MNKEPRTMQMADAAAAARAPENTPAMVKKIGKTTYKVHVHFSNTSTETMSDKIKRMLKVFAEHLRQSPDFELLWSDKVGYVWLTIGVNPVYVDTGIRIESAADLCGKCLDDVATDVLYMTGNDHALEAADPLELAEIKRLWEPYINQLPDYAYLCKDLLNGKM